MLAAYSLFLLMVLLLIQQSLQYSNLELSSYSGSDTDYDDEGNSYDQHYSNYYKNNAARTINKSNSHSHGNSAVQRKTVNRQLHDEYNQNYINTNNITTKSNHISNSDNQRTKKDLRREQFTDLSKIMEELEESDYGNYGSWGNFRERPINSDTSTANSNTESSSIVHSSIQDNSNGNVNGNGNSHISPVNSHTDTVPPPDLSPEIVPQIVTEPSPTMTANPAINSINNKQAGVDSQSLLSSASNKNSQARNYLRQYYHPQKMLTMGRVGKLAGVVLFMVTISFLSVVPRDVGLVQYNQIFQQNFGRLLLSTVFPIILTALIHREGKVNINYCIDAFSKAFLVDFPLIIVAEFAFATAIRLLIMR